MKREGLILEIRAAEGGKDAKLLVEDMASIYMKACENNGYHCETDH